MEGGMAFMLDTHINNEGAFLLSKAWPQTSDTQ